MTAPEGGPLSRYREMVKSGELTADTGQQNALGRLQLLWVRLKEDGGTLAKPKSRGLFGFSRRAEKPEPQPRGLYIYGGVGIGKSMMMDLFYEDAPIDKKRRVHFHDFMQSVHAALREERSKGTEDPLRVVGKDIAAATRLLCFDEVQVTDIADAMILGRLFETLFQSGTIIVGTSNRHPDDLYKNGLNRHLFVPFIEEIKARLDILHVEGPPDYRKESVTRGGVWFAPQETGQEAFDALWRSFSDGQDVKPASLHLPGRAVDFKQATNTALRASFDELCARPLGAADYLALAKKYPTVFLDGLPLLSPEARDRAKRFVTLIDALYEAKARLIVLAEAEPDDLYPKGDGAFEFERTASRLSEMRSVEYLSALPAPE